MLRALALALTVLTGISGLVYEVAWQKYLATLLGSHSEATAAVLGLFLAGLSIGYSVFGVVSRRVVESGLRAGRPPKLLLTYGVAEAAVGAYALAFPTLFRAVAALSQSVGFHSAGASFAFDVALSALLLLPPTILMGGTIPMLTQGLSRDAEDATRLHALVYAFNTVGAFGGALLAGFLLIPWLGLENVMYATSAINLGAGAVFVVAGRRGGGAVVASGGEARPRIEGFAWFCAVSLLSGFAMMSLQTVFIRVGGLSFGSSEYTFATVVAVFVLCIALGSFAVSALRHVPERLLAWNQWLLVATLIGIYAVLDRTPYWIHLLRIRFGASPEEFYLYHLAGGAGFALLAGLPLACSGATLPLLFHHMRRQASELGSLAGHIYSWNTVGSLLGALLGGYALLFWLDLDGVYRTALLALVASACILSARVGVARTPLQAVAMGLLALAAIRAAGEWRPELLATGLFRDREAAAFSHDGAEAAARRFGGALVFYDDDPTMSVAIRDFSGHGETVRALATNGKGDGSTREDYGTMALVGLIPAWLTGQAEKSFVIGLGTGVSAGELASLDASRRVVVAEISPGVIEGVRYFDFANSGVSHHPKIEMVRSDAYRALLRTDERFDIIVSEPSNPWVTGVEMLFSREFLEAARGRLAPGGVYAQWFHQYETSDEVLELVLRTYASVFDRVAVWYAWKLDLVLLGFDDEHEEPDLGVLAERFARPDLRRGFERSRVASLDQLLAHELLPTGVVREMRLEGPIHELFHPRLSHLAGRAFFAGGEGHLPFSGFGEAARVGARRSLLQRRVREEGGTWSERLHFEAVEEACSERYVLCSVLLAHWHATRPDSPRLKGMLQRVSAHGFIFGNGEHENPYEELATLYDEGAPIQAERLVHATALFAGFYRHAAPFSREKLRSAWALCHPTLTGVADCAAARREVDAMLDLGTRPSFLSAAAGR